jgi:phosphoribosylanthranilate isomerase
MITRVKICGLTRPEDIAAAIECGADFLGFIVQAPSQRRLSVEAAAKLARPAKGAAQRVAVTVDPDDALLARICAEMAPEYIQCHGAETPERLAQISKKFDVKTIKAVSIREAADMKSAEQYVGACDFILYDAPPPSGSNIRGGHGLKIDWALIKQAPLPKIFALAGGLTPDNAKEAAAQTGAAILDVSSGVEKQPGVKDAAKINAFIKAAKERRG